MYQFMIVDDDTLVRQRILSAIPTEAMQLSLCAEADNGIQALELFEQHHPQIVIMDINIPLMNGLDVAKQILAENADVSIIIVTGYGTVDFAKEAIRSGMIDFLLKPINGKELEAALQRIVQKIETQSRLMLEQQRMERLLEKSMPLLRSRYFLSLMTTPPDDLTETECRRYLKDFGVTTPASHICTVFLCPNYNGLSVNQQMPLQSILEEELKKASENAGIGCLVFFDSLQRVIAVSYGGIPNLDYVLEQKLSIIRDKMRYVYRFDFHASIGCVVSEFSQLRESYRSAERALGYMHIFGENNVVSSDNLKNIDLVAPQQQTVSLRYNELMDLLVSADLGKVNAALEQFFTQLTFETKSSVQILQQKAIELLALLRACTQELGGNVATPTGQGSPYTRILLASSAREIHNILIDSARLLLADIYGRREQHKNRAIGGVKLYIHQHFSDPELSLSAVAENVNLSPSYVSQLFKKTENCSFADYLNQVRVEQAKHLLSTTHMRVYEVATAVGYQNSKYFFQIFKQLTGKRPREFYECVGSEHT